MILGGARANTTILYTKEENPQKNGRATCNKKKKTKTSDILFILLPMYICPFHFDFDIFIARV